MYFRDSMLLFNISYLYFLDVHIDPDIVILTSLFVLSSLRHPQFKIAILIFNHRFLAHQYYLMSSPGGHVTAAIVSTPPNG